MTLPKALVLTAELSELSVGVWWFDAGSSRRRSAHIQINDGIVTAICDDGARRDAPLRALDISSRLGTVPRRVVFPDGVSLSVEDNNWIDAELARYRRRWTVAIAHRLESCWHWLLLIAAVTSNIICRRHLWHYCSFPRWR